MHGRQLRSDRFKAIIAPIANKCIKHCKDKYPMIIQTNDIRHRIECDFRESASAVYSILETAISTADYLNTDRIIRCILFLADKDIGKLKQLVETATRDPRDIIVWAEYTNVGQWEDLKRIRDFNKSFDNADKNVEE